MSDVFITSTGVFLPGEPISNDEMEDYLGRINGSPSAAKSRVLKQNGIQSRHYAIDKNQKTLYQNADLAAHAIENTLEAVTFDPKKVQLLATGTTQGDLPVPGFASTVHARSGFGRCELASFQSVCSSGVMAIQTAFQQLKNGEKTSAVCVGSDLSSRLFKASRFDTQNLKSVPFDTDFLRWMLSDGAGAFLLENKKPANRPALKIDWVALKSFANDFPLCMYVGKTTPTDGQSWLDYENYEAAVQAGALNLKQDIRKLDQVIQNGVTHFFELIDEGKIDPKKIDWLCCHYSSEIFVQPIRDLLAKGGVVIEESKWFSNLTTKGNTGSASIFIMVDELFKSGRLRDGDTILCMVPESGQSITSFMQFKVSIPQEKSQKAFPIREIEAPKLELQQSETAEWLVRQLTHVWVDFETELLTVPIVRKIHEGHMSIEDYKLLLKDLRQQVIDGSQWISRAASNISIDLFELRSAFIVHTAAEHKDYQMLERNYAALGENVEDLTEGAEKNIGSQALTAFMFHQAGQPNPIDLLGAMFIIEGIGNRLAAFWGVMIQEQLGLRDDQVSFFTYHGVADEGHFKNLEKALNHPRMTMDVAKRVVKTARIVARLYKMQLMELGNY
ncbi:MAG TPA: 3-oxoacyl-[acyl-carrier-protein] synthase III C-terminal domain-containing protein [Saprospiraceae bacterium]|nr:3-oxoacyl-[acyl-carrier-protein] synthase III C-terminal domain-containing protein [Saprospiraceae bacterium]HPI05172.1 3-oxoacyl-[acyl-carrier-protein] synthase III C-terminal domain-containing protein [Saprospiraceae bacterium]